MKNVLERALTFNDTGVIQVSELEFGDSTRARSAETPKAAPKPADPGNSLEDMEREHIIRVLKETQGNKKKAAEILGIERRTLYNKAKRLGIDLGRAG